MPEVVNPQIGEIGEVKNQSSGIGKLADALAKAQAEIFSPKATKTATIPTKNGGSYSYKYADLAGLIAAAQAPLSKNGLAVIQTFEPGSPSMMHTTLAHSSGEWIRSTMPMQLTGLAPQAVGSIVTYMRRYSFSAIIGVAAEEDDDGNGAGASKGAKKPPAHPPKGKTPPKPDPTKITPAQQTRLFTVAKGAGFSDAQIKDHLVQEYGIEHSRDIKRGDYDAICSWFESGGGLADCKSEREPGEEG